MTLLLDYGADPNFIRCGANPLYMASFSYGSIPCVQLLLDRGAYPTLGLHTKKINNDEIQELVTTHVLKRFHEGIDRLRLLRLHYTILFLWRDYWYEQLDAEGINRHCRYLVEQEIKAGNLRC